MEMEGMEGAILIFMLGNMEQTVARKQTKREKNNAQKRTEGWKQKGIWLLWYSVVPVFAFYLMECYEHNPFAEVRVGAQLFNIFLFELIGWMLYFLTGRMCFASRVLYGLAVAFGITNHYVMKFRSTPFVPWDLFSAGTAASVAGNYDFTPDRRMVIVTLVFIALFVLTRFFKKGPRFSWKIRLGSIVLVGLVLCTFVNALQQESFQTKHYLYPFLFTPAYMTKVNGMAVTFAMDLAYVAVERPAGYDADEAKETLAKYETKTTETDTQDLPNIIVIMDEAFSDLKVLGPLETNEDYMPFMHRMQQGEKNTVTGYVQTSVCGGNTADSEFEFLTGNTMAFLPNGSIPYQQYIKSRTPSLAGYLKSLGYATYAQHPYQESFQTKHYLYPFLFTPAYMTKVNGMAVTFAMDLAYVAVERPAGYDADEAKETLAKYETKTTETDTQDLPNIIVIMDEAFSDLKVLGPLETNEDYMPFMHRMQQGEKNTVTGYVQTSVCGGNTADSEFEFLTGNTMAFLPNGSIPYQQYIKSRTPSLAGYLKSLGYATSAQHPYQASGWNRDKVYPLLGFDNLDFMEDYRDVSYVRNYISDASDMEHIIETYEKNKASGKPAFIFNVTMQNHGGYTDTYMNLTNDIQSQYASEPLNQYLTLIHKTDQALENLIDYFSKVDDRTIIVFFGDHQPNDTVASVVENGAQVETQKRYLVPYLVWSNYGIEGAKDKNTSMNYLAAQVLTAAGVPTNAYQNYLLSLSKTYPVISAAGQTKGIGADEKQLQTYKKLQYYQLFEKNKEKDE